MRNLSRIFCLNESHILREGILSKAIDHAHQSILESFCLEKRITRCIISLGHYMKSTRFLEPTAYKRGVQVHSSTRLKHWKEDPWDQSIPTPNSKIEFIAPSPRVDCPVAIHRTRDDGKEYWSDY